MQTSNEAEPELTGVVRLLGQRHEHPAAHSHAAPRRGRRLGERLFLASGLDRLLFVVLLVALLWLAVVWAMG